jgi:hypothetical protein
MQPLLNGTYELLKVGESDSVELVYQAPDNATAVLLLAHGCSHSATDWWPRGAHCDASIVSQLPPKASGGWPSPISFLASREYAVCTRSIAVGVNGRCWGGDFMGGQVS